MRSRAPLSEAAIDDVIEIVAEVAAAARAQWAYDFTCSAMICR
jgi:hypothetical protein